MTKPTVCGKGYIGDGPFFVSKDYTLSPIYECWASMLKRCYSKASLRREPQYMGCEVCEEWLNYQVFAQWYVEHYPDTNEKWQLDKDILIKNNKIYSPATCCFVPQRLNALLTLRRNHRGNYAIGVGRRYGKYVVRVCEPDGKRIERRADTEEEAFFIYKTLKEATIRYWADFYKKLLEPRVYVALCDWKIERND